MAEPLLCAIMLTRDRPAMAARAVRCFREQTYGNVLLFVLDTSEKCTPGTPYGEDRATTVWMPEQGGKHSIGILRNGAIRAALGWQQFDIVAHFDDDDWSHPNRIAEQVALLQATGKDAVGYREILFWRTFAEAPHGASQRESQAWLYSHAHPSYIVGTSLCYWRRTWERRPFKDLPKGNSIGEDTEFINGLDTLGVTTFHGQPWEIVLCACGHKYPRSGAPCSQCHTYPDDGPRMIASIHGGNSSGGYDFKRLAAEGSRNWKRVPEWDEHCRERMKL